MFRRGSGRHGRLCEGGSRSQVLFRRRTARRRLCRRPQPDTAFVRRNVERHRRHVRHYCRQGRSTTAPTSLNDTYPEKFLATLLQEFLPDAYRMNWFTVAID